MCHHSITSKRNRHADPLRPFYALPLQNVKWAHMQKLHYQRGEIIYLGKATKSAVNKKTICIYKQMC